MTETLYLDLLFLVNLFADLSLLLLTGLVLQIPLKKRKGRLLLGAAVGRRRGVPWCFFPNCRFLSGSFWNWWFRRCSWRGLLLDAAVFEMLRWVTVLWMTAALTGGVFVALETPPWTFQRFSLALGAAGECCGPEPWFLKWNDAPEQSL